MRAKVSSAELWKEIRALLPLWAASVAGLAGAAVSRRQGFLWDAGVAAYIVGPVALGAHAIGHEYTYRTLPLLLSQPADRWRVYARKFAVVAMMALTLAAFAWIVLTTDGVVGGMWGHRSVQILPVLGGIFVAPWLTMICRSSLAGTIFTASVAASTLVGSTLSVSAWFGLDAEAAQAMIVGPWSRAMIAFCALAGVLSVRRFRNLEAIEGASPSFHLPRWLRRSEPRRVHHPLASLLVKELHLQEMTFVVAGLFILGSFVASLLPRVTPLLSGFPIGVVTLLYCMSLSILIGALASAEERQHGTLDWHLLQPTSAWRQWMIKVAVSLGLAVVFGAALPVVLTQWGPPQGIRVRLLSDLPLQIVLLTACSLYVSSLCGSGMRAMVLSLPIGVGAALFIQTVSRMLRWATLKLAGSTMADIVSGAVLPSSGDPAFMLSLSRVLTAAMVPLLVWFAFVNHSSLDRPLRRISRQVASIAAVVTIGMVVAEFAF